MNPWYMHSSFAYSGWGHLHSITFDLLVRWSWPKKMHSKMAFMYWSSIERSPYLIKKLVTCMRLNSYFGNKVSHEIYCFPKGAGSTYAFGSSTSTKRHGAYVEHQNRPGRLSALGAERSAVRMARSGSVNGPRVRRINYDSSFLNRFVSDLHGVS